MQDAFLGLTRARQGGTTIADPKAYLTTAVTRLGINYLSSARVRRETYVGDWLPEPVVVPAVRPWPAEHAELADSLSMAFLVLLEALSPVERAVLGRRRQGAGDREAAGPAVARHAAARRPAPPGPGPLRLRDPAGLGRRPAERRVVRRQGRVVSVVELDVADGVVRRSALWSTPASLVISDRCLMWRDCRPRRTPNSEPRSTVTQRTGIPSRTAAMRALSESRVGYAP